MPTNFLDLYTKIIRETKQVILMMPEDQTIKDYEARRESPTSLETTARTEYQK